MKKILPMMIAAMAAASLPTAVAQGLYADGGYTFLSSDVDVDGASADLDFGTITGHVGYEFNQTFGVEGEIAIGVNDEDFSDGITDASIGVNHLVGAYGRAKLPVTQAIDLFARAGIVHGELEAEITGLGSDTASETGAAIGVGGTIDISETMYVRGDYTRYDIEDFEADAITVALGIKF